jgi:hypothetical protein
VGDMSRILVYEFGPQIDREVVWWSKSREEPWRAQAASPRQSRPITDTGK